MNATEIAFGFACVPANAGYFGKLAASWMFFPQWMLVFNALLFLIDNKLYFTLASNILLSFLYYYALAFSHVFAVERPAGFDWERCRQSQFALPDPLYVPTIAYTIVVGVGFWRDHIQFGWYTGTLAFASPIIYSVAMVYTNALSAGLLVANLAIALATATVFIGLYQVSLR